MIIIREDDRIKTTFCFRKKEEDKLDGYVFACFENLDDVESIQVN